jgi:hypothetical protein
MNPISLLAVIAIALLAVPARSQDSTSTLRIKADVTDVEVLIDGESAGRTPLTLSSVKPGKIKLTLVKPGFEDHTREADAVAGKTVSVFVVMKKILGPLPELPMSFLGVHEHTAGRCYGRLVVHRDHIEYKADRGPDSFQIPLTSVTFLSRSTGPLFVIPTASPTFGGGVAVGAYGVERRNPAGVLPVRVETKERKYGFWVYEEGGEATNHTTSLYLLLSRLVAETPVAPPVKK